MVLFKRIEIDTNIERERINKLGVYNKRQRNALIKLMDLFEAGEWQACLDHINNKKQFPYNRCGYSEIEHIGVDISDIIHNMAYSNYYTQSDLLNQAWEKLKKNG